MNNKIEMNCQGCKSYIDGRDKDVLWHCYVRSMKMQANCPCKICIIKSVCVDECKERKEYVDGESM